MFAVVIGIIVVGSKEFQDRMRFGDDLLQETIGESIKQTTPQSTIVIGGGTGLGRFICFSAGIVIDKGAGGLDGDVAPAEDLGCHDVDIVRIDLVTQGVEDVCANALGMEDGHDE